MAKKPRIPLSADLVFCDECGLNKNGKGYFGPVCQCDRPDPKPSPPGNNPWGQPPR